MINATLRTWIRKTGLTRWLNPLVSWVERGRLTRICNYQVEVVSSQVLFRFDGEQIALPSSHGHFRSLALAEHERPTTAVFLKYIAPGETVWDIGANAGFYSWMASVRVGESGRVISFEPNPSNFQLLTDNITALELSNITPLQLALADYEGEAQMEKADRITSESRLTARETTAPTSAQTTTVTVASGDALVARQDMPIPGFIKVDVEGYEFDVLRGMKAVLASPACRKLLCEVHFTLLAERGISGELTRTIATLRQLGFNHLSWVSRSHLFARKN